MSLAEEALKPDSPCATLFDTSIIGKSVAEFFDDVRSMISFKDKLYSDGIEIWGSAGGTPGTWRLKRKDGTEFYTDTVLRKSKYADLEGIQVAPAGGRIKISRARKGINNQAKTLLHELGHLADAMFGAGASKLINDAGVKAGERKAQKKNRATMKECNRFIDKVLKGRSSKDA